MSLLQTAKKFPSYADALIEPVLNDPEKFTGLIHTVSEFIDTVGQFPNQREILENKLPEETLEELKLELARRDIKEISKHARLMGIFKEQNQTLLHQLSFELAKKIILDTRSFGSLSDEDTNEQIDAEYNKGVEGLPQSVSDEQASEQIDEEYGSGVQSSPRNK